MKFLVLSFFLVTVLVSASAQSAEKQIFVVARKAVGGLDLGAEKKVKDELGKQKKIKTTTSAAGADVVLLVLTEYETANTAVGTATGGTGSLIGVTETFLKTVTAFAIPAIAWSAHKDDLEKLREAAIWQGDVAATMLTRASLSKLVKKYIESLDTKKN